MTSELIRGPYWSYPLHKRMWLRFRYEWLVKPRNAWWIIKFLSSGGPDYPLDRREIAGILWHQSDIDKSGRYYTFSPKEEVND